MPNTQGPFQKRLLAITGQVFLALVVATTGFLFGCSEAPASSSGVLSIRLEDGVAWLGDASTGIQLGQGKSLDLNWNQTIRTGEDQSATLLVGDSDRLWLDPNSGFRVISPIPPEQRPVLRLLEGRLRYRAESNRYMLGTRFEVPSELRILVTDLTVAPVETGAEFQMLIEDDVVTVIVSKGEIAARGNGVSENLFTDWRAIVRPGEPMEVIPPRLPDTPTPTVTSTPTGALIPVGSATSTATATLTPTPTLTATFTLTPSPTFRPRLSPSATSTLAPTEPPPPPTQPPPPPAPTRTPAPPTQPPPPTDTAPPPPTDTLRPPPPTNTVRPTLGAGS